MRQKRIDSLIDRLVADLRPSRPSLETGLFVAIGVGLLAAVAGLYLTIGPRPDFVRSLASPRFVAKFVFTFILLATAAGAMLRAARPGQRVGLLWLAAPLGLISTFVALELRAVPQEQWMATLIGNNWYVCLTFIPVLGLVPLALMIWIARNGAPTSSAEAGAVAGLVAGALSASAYAAHCTDDSPLFVATWYPLGIAPLVALGAVVGRLLIRW